MLPLKQSSYALRNDKTSFFAKKCEKSRLSKLPIYCAPNVHLQTIPFPKALVIPQFPPPKHRRNVNFEAVSHGVATFLLLFH